MFGLDGAASVTARKGKRDPRRRKKAPKRGFKGRRATRFDWSHIFDRHAPWGEAALRRSDDNDVFVGMTERQIKDCVKHAWTARKRVETQDSGGVRRVKYRGVDPEGREVEMWHNETTGIVETAYRIG